VKQETEAHQNKSAERRSTSWDIKNALGNYAVMLSSQVGFALVSFVTTYFLLKKLGVEDYGQISAFISAAQLMQISLWWTANAMSRFGVQEFVETGAISDSFWTRTVILLINIALVAGSSFIWLPLILRGFKLPEDSVGTLVVYVVVTSISMHFVFALQASKMMKEQAILQLIEKAAILIAVVILLSVGVLSWRKTLWIYSLVPILTALSSAFLLRGYINWKLWTVKLKRESFLKNLKFSLPIPFYSLLSPLALNYVGTLFIIRYLTKSDLGLFTVATQISGLTMMIPTVLGTLLMPLFVTSNAENVENDGKNVNSLSINYFKQILPILTAALAFALTFFAAILYFIVPYFGEKYAHIGLVLWILLVGGVVSAPVLMGFQAFAFSESSTKMPLFAAFVSAITLLLMNYLLVPPFGLVGSAWASLSAYFVNTFIFELAISKRLGLGLPKTVFVVIPAIVGAVFLTSGFNVFICLFISLAGLSFVVLADKSSYMDGFHKLMAKFAR
jgi:O-antigen/teichoic acid export membrane protein